MSLLDGPQNLTQTDAPLSLEPLPFRDGQFDFVRMSHVALAVPEDEWQYLFEVDPFVPRQYLLYLCGVSGMCACTRARWYRRGTCYTHSYSAR